MCQKYISIKQNNKKTNIIIMINHPNNKNKNGIPIYLKL